MTWPADLNDMLAAALSGDEDAQRDLPGIVDRRIANGEFSRADALAALMAMWKNSSSDLRKNAGIPGDYGARYAACVASRDATEAALLIAGIRTSLDKGSASGRGWYEDLAKLAEIAERGPGIGKRLAKATPSEVPRGRPAAASLPAPMQARVDVTLAKMRRAETGPELLAAKAEGEALVAELAVHDGIRTALQQPRAMGLAR